ncbi:MAG: MarR family winged helix-turn-helix transcriptional regulator [Chloroflexota bacterium]
MTVASSTSLWAGGALMEEAYYLYSLLKESFLLLDFGDRQLFEQFGLTVPRYYAMYHIATSPGTSPSRLSDLMFCDKSNITRLLQGLEADGYIERRSHEYDGRVQRIYLTEKGESLQRRIADIHDATIEHRLCGLAHNEKSRLTDSLEQLNRSLSDDLQQSGLTVQPI